MSWAPGRAGKLRATRPTRLPLTRCGRPRSIAHSATATSLLPAYTIPKHMLAVTEDEGTDAADALPDEVDFSLKAMRRRYERAMDTSRSTNIYAYRTNPNAAKTWRNTLMTAAKSASWLMEHELPLLQDEERRTQRASGSSSSSQHVPSSPINTNVPPPPPPSRLAPPPAPPPPTKAKARPPRAISGTTHVPKQPKFPPPPAWLGYAAHAIGHFAPFCPRGRV